MHMSFCSDKPILAGFSESFAPCPVSAFEGRHDGDVICLMQRIVDTPTPQCSPNVLCCESRQLSQKREGYCWRTHCKVLAVPFLGEFSSAFLPSKKACGIHKLRHF